MSRPGQLAVVVAAVAIAGFGAARWWHGVHGRAASSPATSSTSEEAGVTHGRTLTSYGPPKTDNKEAAAAYAAALEDMRAGSIPNAAEDLQRATQLDPTLAAAYVRMATFPYWGGSARMFATASKLHDSLDGRDLMLLPAAEAMTRDPVDWNEVAGHFRNILDRFPDDVEVLMDLGMALEETDRLAEARAALEHAIAIDPNFAGAMWGLAESYVGQDNERAARVLDQCLAVSPSATSCLRDRAYVHQESGECADYEAASRLRVSLDPKGVRAYWSLADALAVRGAPIDEVREALEKKSALNVEADPSSAAANKAMNDVALGALAGDFSTVAAASDDAERLAAGNTHESAHAANAMTLISSLEEEGEPAKALEVAEAFERRAKAWTADDWSVRLYLLYARHHARKIDDAELGRSRDALEREAIAHMAMRWAPTVRIFIHATYADASDLPDALHYVTEPSANYDAEAYRGRVLLMAGKIDDAIPPLRRAAGMCAILPVDDGFSWRGHQAFGYVRSHLWLGQALEAKGDTVGACGAYGVVIERWKSARPRSVTLQKAKERSRALACH